MSGVKMLDLFSGIGGFHEGFKRAGYDFDWVGFSEIDKYASAVYRYNYKESEELGDITTIRPGRDTPDNIDILCAGFPCQAFSVAGKRLGFDDTRGTLFFEIARLLTHYVENKRPIRCLVLENVKGLLSHDNGRTFAVIYRVLSDLGYTIEFQLLNTRWWLPQNRERIYIVGYIGNRGKPQVFPIGYSDEIFAKSRRKRSVTNQLATTITQNLKRGVHSGGETLIQVGTIGKDSEATRVYDANGISRTIKDGGGMGAKTGLYQIPEATKKGYAEAEVGDSNRKNKDVVIAHTTHPRSGNPNQGGTGPLSRNDGNSYCLDTANAQAVEIKSSIRRLTPVECNRLQGFSDDHNKYGEMDGKVVEMSDTQRYKQAGNAVTVDVVQAVATIIKQKEII